MKRYDLVHTDNKWKLHGKDSERASVVADTKEKAVHESVRMMKRQPVPVTLKIHKVDGTIEEERTFPRKADPRRSPG